MSKRFNLQPAQDQAPIANATFHTWTRPLQADDKAGIDRFVLERINGQASLGEIAEALAARYPERFAEHMDALTYSADLAECYRPEPE